jgi:hypothetical protein
MSSHTCLIEHPPTKTKATISLPNTLYDKILERAHQQNKSLEDLIAEVVQQSIPSNE